MNPTFIDQTDRQHLFVSVIVPVFNVQNYLHRCVDSVLAQTYPYFEVLLIDDGSKDSSGAICDEYQQKNEKVRVVHKPNGGVGSARNCGIREAKGDWIAFVDSDDWLDTSYLQNFVDVIECKPVIDLVLQACWMNYETSGKEELVNLPDRSFADNYELVKYLEEDAKRIHNGFIWHRLYKAALIKETSAQFPEWISFAEDGLFFFKYMRRCHHIEMVSKPGYHYLVRKGSLTSQGGKVPVKDKYQLLTQYVENLLAFEMPTDKVSDHTNFVRKYAWRLMEGWLIIPYVKRKDEDGMAMADVLISKYQMHQLKDASITLRMLNGICMMKDSGAKRLLLKLVLLLRNYEKKIKRHI